MPLPSVADAPRRAAPSDDPDADRQFWLAVRRAFLGVVDAIEQRYAIPSVIEQHERRKASQKP